MILRTALCLLFCTAVAAAEPGGRSVMVRESEASAVPTTGNLRVDLFGMRSLEPGASMLQEEQAGAGGPSRKSPLLAAGLSLLVPGAGEFYAGSYWKSAAFFAVEVAALALAYQYDRRGDRQTSDFERFADQHWNVVRYAEWTLDNAAAINPLVDVASFRTGGPNPVIVNGTVNWARLNELERAIGSFYSHTLPPYGDQQYYELIGKYPQFSLGWDDADATVAPEYEQVKARLSPNFLFYSGERGKANRYYDRASTFVTIVVVNHVLSALDAAWSASSFNKDLSARMEMMSVPVGERTEAVPAVRIVWGL